MKTIKNTEHSFFLCPAADYLNQYNETGSHGQIAYQFMDALAKKSVTKNMCAVVIMSLPVRKIPKTTIEVLVKKQKNRQLLPHNSLYFYLFSYIKFMRSRFYRDADIVHHIIPYAFTRSFNLFFLFKNPSKKYILGPIIGPHINTQITADEVYVFQEKKPLFVRLKSLVILVCEKIGVKIFGSFLYYLSLKTLQNADVVLFSDKHALEYHKKFLLPSQKRYILDTGIDTRVFKPSKKIKIHKKNEPIHVLFVGRLTKRKGCVYLIQALHEAKKRLKNIPLHLSILGIGPLEEELRKLVDDLSLTHDVTFLGGVKSNEEIVNFYHKTDIVCLPALSETFTVAKEAIASGKPVIVTDVGSHAERVKNNVDGFVVPPMESTAIANVLIKIAKDPSLLTALSKNASKTSDLYNWNMIADEYLKIIK